MYREFGNVQRSRQRYADADGTVAGKYQWWVGLEQYQWCHQHESLIHYISVTE
jgi:hypothetical protein